MKEPTQGLIEMCNVQESLMWQQSQHELGAILLLMIAANKSIYCVDCTMRKRKDSLSPSRVNQSRNRMRLKKERTSPGDPAERDEL